MPQVWENNRGKFTRKTIPDVEIPREVTEVDHNLQQFLKYAEGKGIVVKTKHGKLKEQEFDYEFVRD